MGNGAVLSGLLHVIVLGLLVFGLPSLFRPLTIEVLVPVDVVMLDEAPVDAPPVQKPEPAPEPEPAKAEAPPPAPKPPVLAEAQPEPEPVVEPEPAPVVEPEPEPLPEPEPAPREKVDAPLPKPKPKPQRAKPVDVAKPALPKPLSKPRVKTAQKPAPAPDRLSTILRDVARLKKETKDQRPLRQQENQAPPQVSRLEQAAMVRTIQQQMERCWRIEPGARDAQDLVVEIRVFLNKDGTVRRTEIIDVTRMLRDSYFRSAAENAKRAILKCSPFALPLRKYDLWRDMTLSFNPREMFGA